MQRDTEWLTLPETAEIFRMNLNALKAYLSIHKEKFTRRQYRTRGPGKPGRCRVLSVLDLIRLGELRNTERLLDNETSPFRSAHMLIDHVYTVLTKNSEPRQVGDHPISLQLHAGKHHFEMRGNAVIELCQFLQAALEKAGVTL